MWPFMKAQQPKPKRIPFGCGGEPEGPNPFKPRMDWEIAHIELEARKLEAEARKLRAEKELLQIRSLGRGKA